MYLAAFRAMQASGFNINRVFLDELPNRGIGGSTDATVRTYTFSLHHCFDCSELSHDSNESESNLLKISTKKKEQVTLDSTLL